MSAAKPLTASQLHDAQFWFDKYKLCCDNFCSSTIPSSSIKNHHPQAQIISFLQDMKQNFDLFSNFWYSQYEADAKFKPFSPQFLSSLLLLLRSNISIEKDSFDLESWQQDYFSLEHDSQILQLKLEDPLVEKCTLYHYLHTKQLFKQHNCLHLLKEEVNNDPILVKGYEILKRKLNIKEEPFVIEEIIETPEPPSSSNAIKVESIDKSHGATNSFHHSTSSIASSSDPIEVIEKHKIIDDMSKKSKIPSLKVLVHPQSNRDLEATLLKSGKTIVANTFDKSSAQSSTTPVSASFPLSPFGATTPVQRNSLFQPSNISSSAVKKRPALKTIENSKTSLYDYIYRALQDIYKHPNATIFQKPVSKREARDYYDVIMHPIDISTMKSKLKAGKYKKKIDFAADIQLMFDNCRQYNTDPEHFARKEAAVLEPYCAQILKTIPDTLEDIKEEEVFTPPVPSISTPISSTAPTTSIPVVELKDISKAAEPTSPVNNSKPTPTIILDTPPPKSRPISTTSNENEAAAPQPSASSAEKPEEAITQTEQQQPSKPKDPIIRKVRRVKEKNIYLTDYETDEAKIYEQVKQELQQYMEEEKNKLNNTTDRDLQLYIQSKLERIPQLVFRSQQAQQPFENRIALYRTPDTTTLFELQQSNMLLYESYPTPIAYYSLFSKEAKEEEEEQVLKERSVRIEDSVASILSKCGVEKIQSSALDVFVNLGEAFMINFGKALNNQKRFLEHPSEYNKSLLKVVHQMGINVDSLFEDKPRKLRFVKPTPLLNLEEFTAANAMEDEEVLLEDADATDEDFSYLNTAESKPLPEKNKSKDAYVDLQKDSKYLTLGVDISQIDIFADKYKAESTLPLPYAMLSQSVASGSSTKKRKRNVVPNNTTEDAAAATAVEVPESSVTESTTNGLESSNKKQRN